MIIFDLVHDQVSHYKLGLTSQAIFFLNETILLRPKSQKKVCICLSKITVILSKTTGFLGTESGRDSGIESNRESVEATIRLDSSHLKAFKINV